MFKHLRIFIVLIVGFTSLQANGQDEILFLNGTLLKGKILNKTKYEFTFEDESKKQFVIDKYRVFSFTKENEQESIVYEYDTLSGNFLKVQDMKMFVYGERDANLGYKPRFASLSALGVGATAGFMMQRDQSFVYIPIPLFYTMATLLFPTKVNRKNLKDDQYLKEDEYWRGYERLARSQRTPAGLRTSVVGMAVGFLVGIAVNGNGDE